MAPLTKCPQCGSLGCGWDICRFSGLSHKTYIKQWNTGADQVKREQPHKPEHDMRCDGMPLEAGT